jgi:glycosyltransferase involved in cell wall biosynthesis
VKLAPQSSVAIVIPCFEHGRFLEAAVRSALDQAQPAAEVIVVDDGGSEDLAAILTPFQDVRLIRQDNRGLAAARNRGLREATSDKIIFLDADDELLPDAIAAGSRCFAAHPDAGFVYGGFKEIRADHSQVRLVSMRDRRDLVRCNWVAMIASAMFDRKKLLQARGFDESLEMCEDWDAYLRLSRVHPFASHDELVAVYHRHGSNMSDDVSQLRLWVDEVRDRERERGLSRIEQRAWRQGAHVRDYFYGAGRERSLFERAQGKLSRLLMGL